MTVEEDALDDAAPAAVRRFGLHEVGALAVLVLVVTALFAPLFVHVIGNSPYLLTLADYPVHSVYADKMRQERRPLAPHFLYHASLIVARKAEEMIQHRREALVRTPLKDDRQLDLTDPRVPLVHYYYSRASVAVMVAASLATALIMWVVLRGALGRQRWSAWVAALVAPLLMLVGPIAIFFDFDREYYLGYIGINVWHNPTTILLKPFALLAFYFGVAALVGTRRPGVMSIIGAALIAILALLAKPSFTICLLPALAVYAGIRLVLRRPVHWWLLIVGLVIPSVAVLAWQYSRTYGRPGTGVEFAPLKAMSLYSLFLYRKLAFSTVFPLCVYLAFFRHAIHSPRLNLAWLVFFFGALCAYLMSEVTRAGDGNFTWGGQVALFILFFESLVFVLQRGVRFAERCECTGARRAAAFLTADGVMLCLAAFAVHLYYGVSYYIHMLTTSNSAYNLYY